MQKQWRRRFLILPPVLIAIVLYFILPNIKQPPERVDVQERAANVRIIKAPRMAFTAKAIGYGTTQPSKAWDAVAEVAGLVVWLSDDLKDGKLVSQDSELLRIDDSNFKLALTQAETQLHAADIKHKATAASLELEEKSLELLRTDIERKRKLHQQGTLSQAFVDEAERTLLKGETAVQTLKNTLALNDAERDVARVQKSSAELDMKRTSIKAPFDVRLTDVKIGEAQYANRGQLLFTADGIDAVEIEAKFPIGKLRPLIAGRDSESDTDSATVDRQPGATALDAVVRLKTATHDIEWKARVDRVSGMIDPQTQTLGVIVVIDKPYEKARPGQRPPLARNTFVEVELRKNSEGTPVVIPASAVRQGKVYLVNDENRLEIRKVKPAILQDGAAVIAKGLDGGESILISPLTAAVEGMLLLPQEDTKALKRLEMELGGKKEKGK